MILDLDELESDVELTSDVCIVGAGAAGITLALELLGSGHRVLLLESGGTSPEPATHELSEGSAAGVATANVLEARARVFGGTTSLWAGQVMPLDEIDFQLRPWVPASGWPFQRSELEPYYPRAERVLGVEPLSYDGASWPAGLRRPAHFEQSRIEFRFSQFAPVPNLASAYGRRLESAGDLTVVLHANVTGIQTSDDGSSVTGVEFRSLSGSRGSAAANQYVLCCGGIETPRLLLAASSAGAGPLGNQNDLVGRNFQEHVHVKVPVQPAHRRGFEASFSSRRVGRFRYYPKLAASPELQARRAILHVGADLCYELDPDSPVESAKLIARSFREPALRSGVPKAARTVAKRPDRVLSALYRRFVLKRKLSEGGGALYLCFQCETAPRRESRVRLDDRRTDALGLPRVVVDWQVGELERRTIETFARSVAEEFAGRGVGTIDLSRFPLPEEHTRLARIVDAGAHHMGTTRMHDDPASGVVDRDCRVHGVRNLSIGSSSVFPTGGYANPTLTILALCVRLADRLKAELR